MSADVSPLRYDKIALFNQYIAPFVDQISARCMALDIPFIALFKIACDPAPDTHTYSLYAVRDFPHLPRLFDQIHRFYHAHANNQPVPKGSPIAYMPPHPDQPTGPALFDHQWVYATELSPLIAEVFRLCQQHAIPMVLYLNQAQTLLPNGGTMYAIIESVVRDTIHWPRLFEQIVGFMTISQIPTPLYGPAAPASQPTAPVGVGHATYLWDDEL